MANETILLIEKGEKSELTVEALKRRFCEVKWPETGVIKLSPVEHFQVNSGALRVTDPCYDLKTWCAGTQEGVKNGKWASFVGTAHDKSDLEWSIKRFNKGVDEITFEPSSREEVLEMFTSVNKDGAERDEADLTRLSNFMSAHRMAEALRSNFETEAWLADDPVGRVHYLHIYHEDHPITEMDDTWEKSDIDVGVDSGQAGFVDLGWFTENQVAEGGDKHNDSDWNVFYRLFCAKTLDTKFSFGCLDHAAVSNSGYGDGGYNLYVKRDDQGEVVAARIVYINDRCDEEDENE